MFLQVSWPFRHRNLSWPKPRHPPGVYSISIKGLEANKTNTWGSAFFWDKQPFLFPGRYDFFVVSQTVKNGCVAPTHYNVVYDTSQLKPDHVQRLTYKLCHMYYNWSVSAPCQLPLGRPSLQEGTAATPLQLQTAARMPWHPEQFEGWVVYSYLIPAIFVLPSKNTFCEYCSQILSQKQNGNNFLPQK